MFHGNCLLLVSNDIEKQFCCAYLFIFLFDKWYGRTYSDWPATVNNAYIMGTAVFQWKQRWRRILSNYITSIISNETTCSFCSPTKQYMFAFQISNVLLKLDYYFILKKTRRDHVTWKIIVFSLRIINIAFQSQNN